MGYYQAAPFVREAVQSILAQSHRDLVLVAVDDGSTDDGPAHLDAIARVDPRVRHVRAGRLGRVGALNHGLGVIAAMTPRPPFTALMDADDRALPHRFALQRRWLEQHPDAIAVGGQVRVVDAEGRPLRRRSRYPVGADAMRALLAGMHGTPIANPSAMLRTDRMLEVGAYRDAFTPAEDLDFWLRAAERYPLGNLSDVVLEYRWHGGNLSAQRTRTQRANALRARACAALRRHGSDDAIIATQPLTLERLLALPLPDDERARLAATYANVTFSVDDLARAADAAADLARLERALGATPAAAAPAEVRRALAELRVKLAVAHGRLGRRLAALRFLTAALATQRGVARWAWGRLARRVRRR